MPTKTQHLVQRVAALRSDLNARDQALDDAATENNERELSRRSWFDEAQRLENENGAIRLQAGGMQMEIDEMRGQLAERDALLGRIYEASEWTSDAVHYQEVVQKLVYDALSASAEPTTCGACIGCEDGCRVDRESPQIERDERAEFEQAFVVQEGVFFSKERNEYRPMNGRSIEYTDATDLNLRLQGWQARATLDCPDCGDTGVEPCSKHGWKP